MAPDWVKLTFIVPLKCVGLKGECCEEKYKLDYVSNVFVSIHTVPGIYCLTMFNCSLEEPRKSFEYRHTRHVFP
jgi:hypothetical protein